MSYQHILTQYKNCQTETERQEFLNQQALRIKNLSPIEAKAEIEQQSKRVKIIEQQVETSFQATV